jgi:alpha-L-rhamnosidase
MKKLPAPRWLVALTLGLLSLQTVYAEPAHSLVVGEGFVNPTGFHDSSPALSWKLPATAKKQTAYRIEARTEAGKSWDSGWVESSQSIFVPYGGATLRARDRVTWRVNVRDESGREAGWSEGAHFELGLLSAADWQARWIRSSQEIDSTRERVATLRRTFSLAKPVAKARLHATARGVFALQLNGQRIGTDHFANGFTSYRHRIDTLTYDVTPQLQRGENMLQGLLGTGWYAGRFPFETKHVGPYGTDTALLLQLEITYGDGSTEMIISDERWEGTYEGPVISSSLYDGEVYDARRLPANWSPVTAEAELGSAVLTPKPFAPVRATQTLVPQQITQPQPGRYVFDLGQNMVGWARLSLPVRKDQAITLRFAEMLQADGSLYTENYRTAKSTDTYTAAADGMITWEPHFTFHGFRYVELSGLPADAIPQKDWVTGVVLRSDLPATGHFQSSHAKLNQLQGNIVWGWRGNSLDIPTDCPQRDERMGWTGDAQAFCVTSLFNTGAHAFWKSWLGSMRDDQYADGAVPPFVPTAMSKWETRSPGWMDAATIIPWDVYVRTGDIELLRENYGMMERLVGWYRGQAVDGLLPTIKGFGDWLQPYPKARATPQNKDADRKGDTPLPLLGLAFHARGTQILAEAAKALGRGEDAQRYSQKAAAVRAAFMRQYFDADGKLKNVPETQTGYVLAIAFDLIPAELKTKAGEQLVRLVREADGHLRTGFLGTPFLASALDQTGHADVAAEVIFRETYPSWFYSINQGATTMWERWNSYTRDGGFGDVSMNSFNHYAYGAIGQWLYERVAGLSPDPAQPGYKHFFVYPLITPQLNSARAELETPYGKAVSAWSRQGDVVVLDVVVPPNTTATVRFPDGRASQVVSPGVHRFEGKMPRSP